jgi:hypothetical protein
MSSRTINRCGVAKSSLAPRLTNLSSALNFNQRPLLFKLWINGKGPRFLMVDRRPQVDVRLRELFAISPAQFDSTDRLAPRHRSIANETLSRRLCRTSGEKRGRLVAAARDNCGRILRYESAARKKTMTPVIDVARCHLPALPNLRICKQRFTQRSRGSIHGVWGLTDYNKSVIKVRHEATRTQTSSS